MRGRNALLRPAAPAAPAPPFSFFFLFFSFLFFLLLNMSPDWSRLPPAPRARTRRYVDDLLARFVRFDPKTHRRLHKAHAIRTEDFMYHLFVMGRRPRGNWGDPRPKEKA